MALYEYVGDPDEGHIAGVGGVYKGLVVDSAQCTIDITSDPRFVLAPNGSTPDPVSVGDEVMFASTPAAEAQAQADVQAHL